MHLPNLEHAIVEESKMRDYLLNVRHPDGGSKAGFFIIAGFNLDQMAQFRLFLIRHAKDHPVTREVTTAFGTKYIIDGNVKLPHAFTFVLRTVWMIPTHSEHPILITAYPLTP